MIQTNCIECGKRFPHKQRLRYTATLSVCSQGCLEKYLNSFFSMNYETFRKLAGEKETSPQILRDWTVVLYETGIKTFTEIEVIRLPLYENDSYDIRGRSHLEDRVMLWLKEHGFKFFYEPIMFKYFKHCPPYGFRRNSKSSYIPDFIVLNKHQSVIFVETKGTWDSMADRKIIEFKKFCAKNTLPFLVLEQSIFDRFAPPTKIDGIYW